jgi:excisionase family DNA binding protein
VLNNKEAGAEEKVLVGRMTPLGSVARRLLTIQEVSQYTGLSVHTLYAMVSQRRIPYVKMGRLTKFDKTRIDIWIEKNSVIPMPKDRLA